MNTIELLSQYIHEAFPDAKLNLSKPVKPDGVWSLDVDLADKQIAIEWSDSGGFYVANVGFENFGERPDERYGSLNQVKRRIQKLLTSDEKTTPPLGVFLSRLREQRGFTQKDLANTLGIKQSSISGFERRDDIQISTFWRIIDALGASAEIQVICAEYQYSLRMDSLGVTIRDQGNELEEYREAFSSLRSTGGLEWAGTLAAKIKRGGTVIEFV